MAEISAYPGRIMPLVAMYRPNPKNLLSGFFQEIQENSAYCFKFNY